MIDELDAVREVGTTQDPDPEARARVREAVDRRRGGAPPRRRWPARVGLALAVSAPLAAGVAFVAVVGSDRDAGDPSARTAASPAARAAVPALFPEPQQYLYVRQESRGVSCVATKGGAGACKPAKRVPDVREDWKSFGRTSVFRSSAWPDPPRRGRMHAYLGSRPIGYAALRRLRPTGAGLFRQIRDGVEPGQGNGVQEETFVQITDALRDAPMPPRVRAALAAAYRFVGGVRELGLVRDRLHRRVLGYGYDDPATGLRREVLLDPRTWLLMDERTVVVRPGRSAPTAGLRTGDVAGETVYTDFAIVEHALQRP